MEFEEWPHYLKMRTRRLLYIHIASGWAGNPRLINHEQ
jgi:hypothetical protein